MALRRSIADAAPMAHLLWPRDAAQVSPILLFEVDERRVCVCVQIRSDKNLAYLREDERFTPMMNKFDEPILNENAVKAIKNLFSFGKKD